MAWVEAAQAVVIVSFGPAQAVAHRDRRAGGVGHHHRHEERRDPPLALVEQHLDLLLESMRRPPTPVAKIVPKRSRLGRRPPACSSASAAAARANCSTRSARRASFGLSKYGERIPVGDLDAAVVGDARPEEAVPERLPADAAGRDDAEAGDGDAPPGALHQSLPTTRS